MKFLDSPVTRRQESPASPLSPSSHLYTSFDQLPLMLSLPQTAAVLGISRSAAYALAAGGKDGTPALPVLRIGARMVVPKEALILWIRENTRGSDEKSMA